MIYEQPLLGELEGTEELGIPVQRARFGNQAEQVLFLRQLVDAYRSNQAIRNKAHDIVFRWARCPPRDKLCHAIAVGRWVQEHIDYVNEGEETFQTPIATLTERYGDCDDHTTLIASLLESIGIPCQVVALEWDGQYRHIFPRAVVGKRPDGQPLLVPLDSTLGHPVGEPPLQNPLQILHARGKVVRSLAL